jgi:hypothetical protein
MERLIMGGILLPKMEIANEKRNHEDANDHEDARSNVVVSLSWFAECIVIIDGNRSTSLLGNNPVPGVGRGSFG